MLLASMDSHYEVRPELSQRAARCQIMHEDTRAAHVPGLPLAWPDEAGALCCSLTLPCGHTFNLTAITVHFLHQHMRCPVCRAGHDGVMRIESVPAEMRAAFGATVRRLQLPDAPPQTLVCSVEVDDVERKLQLAVEVTSTRQPQAFTRLAQTRLYRAAPAFCVNFNRYNTQRSFSRVLDTFLGSQAARDGVRVRFCIKHPFFPLPLYSAPLPSNGARPLAFEVSEQARCVARLAYAPQQHAWRCTVDMNTVAVVETCLSHLQQALLQHFGL